MLNIPNTLTIFRIMMVPLVIWAIGQGEFRIAVTAFVVAGITDGVDGFIARKFNQRTTLGAYLDPIADKALIVSIYVSLAIAGLLPRWLVILVVSRDVMIVGAVILSWLMDHPVTIKPLMVSKANTTVQIVLAATVLATLGTPLNLDALLPPLIGLVTILTIASMAAYLWAWMRHMAGLEEPEV